MSLFRCRSILVAGALTVFGLTLADPALAYLKLGTFVGGRPVALTWRDRPVRYFVTNRDAPGVSVAAFDEAVARAFRRWEAVPTASIAYQFAGFTPALPHDDDGLSTIGFLDRPDLDRVLAATSFLLDDETGEIIESDIFFNAAFNWSTSAGGEPGRFDVESIALHEIGHLSGLGHSAIGETQVSGSGRRVLAAQTVMFPIAFPSGNVANRSLKSDDVAGISDLYPDSRFRERTGSISGRVEKDGRGMFGAHIVAFSPATGVLVSNFALDSSGTFSIAGLPQGIYVVRVEPLDDADIDGFFDAGIPIDLNFRATYFKRLVVVPRGGDSGSIQIQVLPK